MSTKLDKPGARLTRAQRIGVWGGMAGAVIGSTAWMVAMAGLNHDWMSVGLTLFLDIAVFFLFGRWLLRYPKSRFLLLAVALVILTAHCLGMFWWRLDIWRADLDLDAADLFRQKKIASLAVGGMVVIVLAQLLFMHWIQGRTRNPTL